MKKKVIKKIQSKKGGHGGRGRGSGFGSGFAVGALTGLGTSALVSSMNQPRTNIYYNSPPPQQPQYYQSPQYYPVSSPSCYSTLPPISNHLVGELICVRMSDGSTRNYVLVRGMNNNAYWTMNS